MRRLLSLLTVALTSGALIGVGLASLLATRGESAPARGGDGAPPGIYFRSQRQADASLARFDREHPQCQLWTNWRKMCSRTGPNGETVCVTDPGRPVAPSEPFCTASEGPMTGRATPAQIASHGRFCRTTSDNGASALRGCAGASDRPFAGRRIAARLLPWCELWADESHALVCQTGSIDVAGVPRCETLARTGAEAPSRLLCARRVVPSWCRTAALLGEGPQYPFSGDHVALGYGLGNPTILGAYCSERR